jgi:hypothetical protein
MEKNKVRPYKLPASKTRDSHLDLLKSITDNEYPSQTDEMQDVVDQYVETRTMEDGFTFLVSEMPQYAAYDSSFIQVSLDVFQGDSVEESDRIGTIDAINLERSRRTAIVFYEMADSKYSSSFLCLDLLNCRRYPFFVASQMGNSDLSSSRN